MTAIPSPTARIIDGKARAAALVDQVAGATERLKADTGIVPGLAAVLVGEDPASRIYVKSKGETATRAGLNSFTHTLSAGTSEQ